MRRVSGAASRWTIPSFFAQLGRLFGMVRGPHPKRRRNGKDTVIIDDHQRRYPQREARRTDADES